MDRDETEPLRRQPAVEAVLKEDLALFSLEELAERITLLDSEIERCRTEIVSKRGSKDAAEAIFKK